MPGGGAPYYEQPGQATPFTRIWRGQVSCGEGHVVSRYRRIRYTKNVINYSPWSPAMIALLSPVTCTQLLSSGQRSMANDGNTAMVRLAQFATGGRGFRFSGLWVYNIREGRLPAMSMFTLPCLEYGQFTMPATFRRPPLYQVRSLCVVQARYATYYIDYM